MSESQDPSYFVVGVGASAGGLEALELFFRQLPSDINAAFVVVQHLSPDFKSLMEEILSKHTDLQIHRVEDGMSVEARNIYLIPPRKNLELSDGVLRLFDQGDERGLNLPIDIFFRSLAEDQRSRAIGIVLSGTGSDGSRGARAIRESGGLVIVQRPETARFDGMPRAALQTGCADFVLAPADMPAKLAAFISNPGLQLAVAGQQDTESSADNLTQILLVLLRERGVDFRVYKPGTVQRRIARRMGVRHVTELNDYLSILREERAEREALFHELLICVTEFFRDEQAFSVLSRRVIPELVKNAKEDRVIRVWVVACATGEEAYSVAMLLDEEIERQQSNASFKIFATDVNDALVKRASEGRYGLDLATMIEPERMERYFIKEGDSYQVQRPLRDRVVFAVHDVVKDPPFTRIDLVTCRNFLIYLQPSYQLQVVGSLHFALLQGGYMMLGPSEMPPAELSPDFREIDSRWRVFEKLRESRTRVLNPFGSKREFLSPRTAAAEPLPGAPEELSGVCSALVRRVGRAAVLVSRDHSVVRTFGDASRYLRIPEGRATNDVLDLLPAQVRVIVSTGLIRAAKAKTEVLCEGIAYRFSEEDIVTDIGISRVDGGKHVPELYLLVFREGEADGEAVEVLEADEHTLSRIDSLEQELLYTKESLQATVEELETSNEELQSTNEELLASNEELQSTNEELHSVNEELFTVNAEHQNKIDELTELSNDVENLLRATEIGTVFLDTNLCLRKFTPAITSTIRLVEHDIGRPITHFAHDIRGVDLVASITRVLESHERIEREVLDREGRPYLLQIRPYRTARNRVEGTVLTMVDVSNVREMNEGDTRRRVLGQFADELALPFALFNAISGEVLVGNRSFIDLFGLTEDDFGKFYDRVHPADRMPLRTFLTAPVKRPAKTLFRTRNQSGEQRWFEIALREVADVPGRPSGRLGSLTDVTEAQLATGGNSSAGDGSTTDAAVS